MSAEDGPRLADLIRRHGLAARHALGQHFLLDLNLTRRIVRLCGDLTGFSVLEVGPGPGGLTRALMETPAARVLAVEIDPRAMALLAELRASDPDRLILVCDDARRFDAVAALPAPRLVCANLPYNVATPLLIGWLRQAGSFNRLVLMFQREVAERICAPPGTPAYGRLSVLAQSVCACAIGLRLPPSAFVPPPEVASAVVCFTPHPTQPAPALLGALERVTEAAFGQRRKMLRTALKPLGGAGLLETCGIDPTRRAETLSVAEFLALASRVAQR